MKSKVDKLDFDKLVLVTVHLSKLSDVVKNVVKKDPSKHLFVFQDVLKTSCEDVLKTFARPLARRLQNVLEDEKLLR